MIFYRSSWQHDNPLDALVTHANAMKRTRSFGIMHGVNGACMMRINGAWFWYRDNVMILANTPNN